MERIIKADPLTTTREAAKELKLDYSTVIQHFKQIGKVKKFNTWVPCKLTPNKNIVILKCLLLFYATTMKHFSIRLWLSTKSGFYVITSSVVGQKRNSKAIAKAKLAPEKVMVTVQWSGDHLQLAECGWNHYIWEVCSANQWDALKAVMPETGIGQQKRVQVSITTHVHIVKPMPQKLNEWGYKIFSHSPNLPDLSPNDYYSFKHLNDFLQVKCFHNQQEPEYAFQEFFESQSTDF